MGKVKFRKLKKLRHNPVNLPSTEEVERARVPENSRSEKQLPVISQVRMHSSLPLWLYHTASSTNSKGFRGRDGHVLFVYCCNARLLISGII